MPGDKYNCRKCIERGQQNNRRYRICLLTGYQHARLDDVPIKDASDFWFRLEEYSERFPAKDLMEIMRDFTSSINDRTGLCIKSLQFPSDIITEIQLVSDCTDGDGNLIHLPYPGTILQQPSIFMDFAALVQSERSKLERTKKEAKVPGSGESKPPPRAPSAVGRFRAPKQPRRRKR